MPLFLIREGLERCHSQKNGGGVCESTGVKCADSRNTRHDWLQRNFSFSDGQRVNSAVGHTSKVCNTG